MTFHKTEQTILKTGTVEGPDREGRFSVYGGGFFSKSAHGEVERILIDKHLESIPKPPTTLDAYIALKVATNILGDVTSGPPLHTQTDLTEEDALELMRLLGVLNA